MRKALWVAGAIAILGLVAWRVGFGGGEPENSYLFVPVERGDLEEVVSSTGTLGAVTTVQVGTQVSGIISAIHADFNDRVEAGRVIAKVDTTLLASAVRDAEASLERSEAELRYADKEFRRIDDLRADGLVSDADMNSAQYALDVANASVKSAKVTLERARRNLGYATIRAPISGTVIERNVDVGQTVQASFSAPQLFLIAADLSRMQILVSVDESDIGRIEEGQTARFTVQAYPDRVFEGMVRQVRLQSLTEDNVVNYTAVADVDNPEGVLLPGMTATVDFLVERAEDVLKVANAALRYRPTDEMLEAFREERRSRRPAGEGGEGNASGGSEEEGHFRSGARPTLLWYVGEDGALAAAPVRSGISDGKSTEVSGRDLAEGMQVIAGATGGSSRPNGPSSPFQQNRPSGGPPRPGGF
ncbi:MAG: efflux RND transporter periplasmic adaptor subunit [Candidatus Eisenbacteria bacterium]